MRMSDWSSDVCSSDLVLGCFFVFVQVNRAAGGVLATYLGSERGLSPTDIGAVMGAMFFASAAVQLPMGILLDRVGATRTLLLAGLLALACIVTFSLATSSWAMALCRVAIGAGHGGVLTRFYSLVKGMGKEG